MHGGAQVDLLCYVPLPTGLWTVEKDVQAAQGAGGGGLAALEQKLIRLLISKTNEVRSPFLLPHVLRVRFHIIRSLETMHD